MNISKISLSFLLWLFLGFFVQVYAEAPYSKIVFFGDSLSDNGNLARISLGFLPKSPPYFKGRFSNGYTWSEHVGKYFYDRYYTTYSIYAIGGATATFHRPTTKFVTLFTLQLQIEAYLVDSLFQNRNNILFVIWIGSNDVVFGPEENIEDLSSRVASKVASAVETLHRWGGRHFLVLNLPDVGATPFADNNPRKARYSLLTQLYNNKLKDYLAMVQAKHDDVQLRLVDIHHMFADALAHPGKYNDKYNLHITNTHDACWKGGFLFRQNQNESLADEIRQAVAQKTSPVPMNLLNGNDPTKGAVPMHFGAEIDPDTLANFIMTMPDAATAYGVSKSYYSGMVPCALPDEYLFWDKLHPTQVVHQILSAIVLEKLTAA